LVARKRQNKGEAMEKDLNIQAQPESGSSDLSSIDTAEEDGGFWATRIWIRFLTKFRWYLGNISYTEKLLVLKLNLTILTFGGLSFFTKYLDQAAITNAYVS
jgi:hypothetical protein